MDLKHLVNTAMKQLQKQSPNILTAIGVGGVVGTSYLVVRATFEAATIIRENEKEGVIDDPKQRFKERTKQVWRLYIPAGVSGVVTIGCIVGSSRISGRRASAAYAAYSLSELAFGDYKDKVVEQLGKNKEEAIRTELAQEKANENPTGQQTLFVVSGGQVLCCEGHTMRYFRSDMETLRKAMNDVNHKIRNEPYVTLDEFYDLIGLAHTSYSGEMGWDSDKQFELQFHAILSDQNEPCMIFEYNYLKPLK